MRIESSFWQKEKTWGFYAFSDCYDLIAAHSADLFVDVIVAVDIVLLYVVWCYPSEYRIVNLTGMAIICAASARGRVLFRLLGGCWFISRLPCQEVGACKDGYAQCG